MAVEWGFFPYFPPLKPRGVSWSSASYCPKNTVNHRLYTVKEIISKVEHRPKEITESSLDIEKI